MLVPSSFERASMSVGLATERDPTFFAIHCRCS